MIGILKWSPVFQVVRYEPFDDNSLRLMNDLHAGDQDQYEDDQDYNENDASKADNN